MRSAFRALRGPAKRLGILDNNQFQFLASASAPGPSRSKQGTSSQLQRGARLAAAAIVSAFRLDSVSSVIFMKMVLIKVRITTANRGLDRARPMAQSTCAPSARKKAAQKGPRINSGNQGRSAGL